MSDNSKRKSIFVKSYVFEAKDAKAKLALDNKTKGNIVIIVIILVVTAIVFAYVLKPKKVIDVKENLKETQVLEKNDIQEDKSANNSKPESVNNTPKYLQKHIDQNPNTVGYIKIKDTKIDYPVVQTDNNEYYISHNYNYDEDKKGAIFMDYRCDIDAFSKTRNIILYGHRMKDGSMFKDLVKYKDENFFMENKIIKFDTLNGEYEWKVFAVFETTTDFYYIDTEFLYDNVWLAFLDEVRRYSIHETNTNLYGNDIVLTLSTCTTEENGRLVVMAKLLQ